MRGALLTFLRNMQIIREILRAIADKPKMKDARMPATLLERITLSLLSLTVSVPIPAHTAGNHPDSIVGYAEIIAAQIGGRTAVGGKIDTVE